MAQLLGELTCLCACIVSSAEQLKQGLTAGQCWACVSEYDPMHVITGDIESGPTLAKKYQLPSEL